MSNLNYKSDFSSKTLFLHLRDQLGRASPREALVGQHCSHSLALELRLFLLQLADTPRRLLWHVSQTESFWTWVICSFSPLLASFSTTLFRKLNYNMITYFLNSNPSYTHTHTHTHTYRKNHKPSLCTWCVFSHLQPRGMEWGGRREEGSGWGTHVYLWRIHFDIWQN